LTNQRGPISNPSKRFLEKDITPWAQNPVMGGR
jgi:hypothetical protein